MSGKLVKLKIEAYKDAQYKNATGDEFETLLNPTELAEMGAVQYAPTKVAGKTSSGLQFKGTSPELLTLNFTFDGTGAVRSDASLGSLSKPESVTKQIANFKKVTFDYIGETHAPPFVKISWGTVLFKGRLESLDIKYSLFKPDASPLRATATAKFKRATEENEQVAKDDSQSPDLTHIRTIKSGDALPLMAKNIYGNTSYYLEVARANGLKHFRELKPGDEIIFPPIDKTTA